MKNDLPIPNWRPNHDRQALRSVQCTWEGHGGWTWWVYDDEITLLADCDVDLDGLL